MIQRNLSTKNCSAAEVRKIVHAVFSSRGCQILGTADPEVVEFSGLLGTSALVRGNGKIAVVELDGTTRLRLEVELFASNVGMIVGVLSVLAALFTVGITLLLFWLLRDRACESIVVELERVIDEIKSEMHGS